MISDGSCSNSDGVGVGCGAAMTVVDVDGGLDILNRCGSPCIQRWIF